LEQDRTKSSRNRNSEKEMGMDRPHTQEAILKHHPPGPGLESAREEESWETKTDLEKEH